MVTSCSFCRSVLRRGAISSSPSASAHYISASFWYWRLCRSDFAMSVRRANSSPLLDKSLFATARQRLRLVLLTRRCKPLFPRSARKSNNAFFFSCQHRIAANVLQIPAGAPGTQSCGLHHTHLSFCCSEDRLRDPTPSNPHQRWSA
jgi:hypothetical protein